MATGKSAATKALPEPRLTPGLAAAGNYSGCANPAAKKKMAADCSAAIPYARLHFTTFSSVCAQSGAAPLIIPVIRISNT